MCVCVSVCQFTRWVCTDSAAISQLSSKMLPSGFTATALMKGGDRKRLSFRGREMKEGQERVVGRTLRGDDHDDYDDEGEGVGWMDGCGEGRRERCREKEDCAVKKNSQNVRLFVLKEKIQEGKVKRGRAKKLIQGNP